MKNVNPEPESLRRQLEIEWQDHFQTRAQSWSALQIEAILFVGLVGADLRFDNVLLVIVFGGLVFLSGLFGFALTATHWSVQERKFRSINELEEALGLHTIIQGHQSDGVKLISIIDPRSTLAVVLMLRLQVVIILVTPIYVTATIILE